ncbi:hypothetical protein [Methylobacterium sp. A54F]
MRASLAAAALATLLGFAPAHAQAPAAAPGAPKATRATTATGTTKPPSGGAPMRPEAEAAMQKAQKAAAARDKAWDARMRTTLGSICRGC